MRPCVCVRAYTCARARGVSLSMIRNAILKRHTKANSDGAHYILVGENIMMSYSRNLVEYEIYINCTIVKSPFQECNLKRK